MPKLIFILAIFILSSQRAHAACVDEVDTLAKKYGVSSALPKATDHAAAMDNQLAASGGVIAPPSTGDTAAISPAMPNPDSMQTAPAIAPQTANGSTETHQGTGEHAAAADSQAASLLMAARQAGLQGDTAACEQGLAKAREMLAHGPG